MNDAEYLKELEETLLIDLVWNNAEHVSSLLAEKFREFGSSGRCFSKAEIIDLLQTESPVGLSLKDFEAYLLSAHVALVTYRAVKDTRESLPGESLRSSIWVFRDPSARWRGRGRRVTAAPIPISRATRKS